MALPGAIRKTWPIPPGPSPCNRAFSASGSYGICMMKPWVPFASL